MTADAAKDRILSFEGLRGLLALWVLLFHLFNLAGLQAASLGPLRFFADGIHPVDIFIIMSGFFIFFLLDAKRETYRPFIARRFLRIFPAYLTALFISILLLDLSLSALRGLPWQTARIVTVTHIFESSKAHFFTHLMTHLTLLQGAVPGAILEHGAYALLGVAWSVSLEWQFYLIAPALMHGFRQKNTLVIFLLLAGLLTAYGIFQSGIYMGFLPQKLPFFLLGIASFFAWKKKGAMPVFIVTALMTFLLISKISVFIWLAVFFTTYFGRAAFLTHPTLLYLGKISYSVYLIHMIPAYLAVTLLNHLHIQSQPLFFALMLLLVAPSAIGLAHLLYHTVEKPCIDWGRTLSFEKPPRVPLPVPERSSFSG